MEQGKRQNPYVVLTSEEASVSRRLQGDIPLTEHPFAYIGKEIGMSEAAVLAIAADLKKRGFIRKFGAILRHRLAGYRHNLMVLWAVPEERCAFVGEQLSGFSEITHCYERSPAFAGRYTLFSMAHFRKSGANDRLREIAAAVGIADYLVLSSREEFKKNSMEYFKDESTRSI